MGTNGQGQQQSLDHQGAVLASDSLVMLEQCQKEATEEKQK